MIDFTDSGLGTFPGMCFFVLSMSPLTLLLVP